MQPTTADELDRSEKLLRVGRSGSTRHENSLELFQGLHASFGQEPAEPTNPTSGILKREFEISN
jgi:hypothetical protein